MDIPQLLQRARPVMPVITLSAPGQALPLAEALLGAGVSVLEITLRTPHGLPAIAELSRREELVVGAGSVTDSSQLGPLREAGAHFAVSPGFDPALVTAARHQGLPLLPGVMTPSEMLQARALGLTHLKLFPADVAGGVALLKAVSGPLSDLRFCPTGGVNRENFRQYLALDNVACVGGSWLVPEDALARGDWATIRALASALVTEQ